MPLLLPRFALMAVRLASYFIHVMLFFCVVDLAMLSSIGCNQRDKTVNTNEHRTQRQDMGEDESRDLQFLRGKLASQLGLPVRQVVQSFGLDSEKQLYIMLDEPPRAFRGVGYILESYTVLIYISTDEPVFGQSISSEECNHSNILNARVGGIKYVKGKIRISVGDDPFPW